MPKNLSYTFGKPGLYTAVTRAKQTLTIMGALDELPNIIRREDVRRCAALKSLLELPLNKPSELKPELKSDLKPDLKPVVIDFAAFRALANKALAGDNPDLSEDDLQVLRDRG